MEEPIKVVLQGLGNIGKGLARYLLQKPGVTLAGAQDINPDLTGRDLGEVLGIHRKLDLTVTEDLESLLTGCKPDIVLQATQGKLTDIYPSLKTILLAGVSCISIAEEMCYPVPETKSGIDELDSLAKKNGATLLGTGINPGFILDYLIIAFTGISLSVDSITATRVNDLSPYGPDILRTQGVGLSPEDFSLKVNEGVVLGHSGFSQSIGMIAASLGWNIDRIEEIRKPIISAVKRKTESVTVNPGYVAGCEHIALGFIKDKPAITLIHPQQVYPHLEGIITGDKIQIKGIPDISITITPEIPWVLGTVALAVNLIPGVMKAPPGYVSMMDLPVPRNWTRDLKELLKG